MTKRSILLFSILVVLFAGMVGLGTVVKDKKADTVTAEKQVEIQSSGERKGDSQIAEKRNEPKKTVHTINSINEVFMLIDHFLKSGSVTDCANIKMIDSTDLSTSEAFSFCVRAFATDRKEISMCNNLPDTVDYPNDKASCVIDVVLITKDSNDCRLFQGAVSDSCFYALASEESDIAMCKNIKDQQMQKNCELNVTSESR